jgi:drug/metabolite transporter (DMT)-like permease
LKTPVDPPTWGPDWIKRGWRDRNVRNAADAEGTSDHARIVDNLDKSRQVARYKWMYAFAAIFALAICGLAMFVDYNIINGDVWTRALANEYMQVPDALKDSVIFKSLQVVFAVLAVHFMLKITGKFGRNALISIAFVLTIIMVGCLGYLVAYNNMDMGTSARLEHNDSAPDSAGAAGSGDSTIDRLLQTVGQSASAETPRARPAVVTASAASVPEVSLPLPKLSERSLANAQGWFWLAFASVIFFIVTAVCALYMQIAEHNVRNWLIARDYKTRRREYDELARLGAA